MLGTIVNVIAILVGGAVGLCLKGGLKPRFQDLIMTAVGLSTLFIGASSALGGLLSADADPILFIISMVIGAFLGELINIGEKLGRFGDALQAKVGGKEGDISTGFVQASLLFCVGSMAILGSLESGVNGNHSILFAKSVLDGVSSIIFASTLGLGVLFSSLSILVYQGLLTLFSSFLQPLLTADMLREISIVGGILIFAIGINMLGIKKVKVGNLLPAVIVPVFYYLPVVQNLLNMLKNLI